MRPTRFDSLGFFLIITAKYAMNVARYAKNAIILALVK
jgi:hypothetical protein